jgi:hypothetical protein
MFMLKLNNKQRTFCDTLMQQQPDKAAPTSTGNFTAGVCSYHIAVTGHVMVVIRM